MKETRRQIIENTRNEVAKKFSIRIKELDERAKKYETMYWEERKKRIEAESKFSEQAEKINQLEDWIRRLQEFMDMDEDSRAKYIETKKAEAAINKMVGGYLGMFDRLFSLY